MLGQFRDEQTDGKVNEKMGAVFFEALEYFKSGPSKCHQPQGTARHLSSFSACCQVARHLYRERKYKNGWDSTFHKAVLRESAAGRLAFQLSSTPFGVVSLPLRYMPPSPLTFSSTF